MMLAGNSNSQESGVPGLPGEPLGEAACNHMEHHSFGQPCCCQLLFLIRPFSERVSHRLGYLHDVEARQLHAGQPPVLL